jgi:Family of unknown function (DUF6502)
MNGVAASSTVSLKAAMSMFEPLAAILLTRQIRYNEAAEVLKAAFVQASARAFVARGKVPSVSTLSVATGIGRVEVKRLLDSPLADRARKASPAGMVRLRWVTDPAYLDDHGQPRRLLRSGGKVSFSHLAETASKDTHPRAILDELLRLGAVVEEGEYVSLRHEGAYRPVGFDDALTAGADNASDHLSAILVNLLSTAAPLLERAVFADGLTHASALRGVAAASEIWVKMLADLREKLQALVTLDEGASDNQWRMRIGVYSYIAPMSRPAPPISARENKKRSKSSGRDLAVSPEKRLRGTRLRSRGNP